VGGRLDVPQFASLVFTAFDDDELAR